LAEKVIVITGAVGFIGSSLVVTLAKEHNIIAIDQRKPNLALVMAAPAVKWIELDIADAANVNLTFQHIKVDYGKIDFVIHLAAYYHFGNDWRVEYENTNIRGTENIVNAATHFGIQRILFSSSIAALEPPRSGRQLNEDTPGSGYIPYAKSKLEGENIIKEASLKIPATILRFGGVFSDWCELPPLYSLIRLWSSYIPVSNMIPGKGESGIPYIHLTDVIQIIKRCIAFHDKLGNCETFMASQSGTVLQRDLFISIKQVLNQKGSHKPIYISPLLAGIGLRLKLKFGSLIGKIPFEQPWMLNYTDRPWIVNNDYTQKRLGWQTNPQLHILKRLPFILNFYKNQKDIWIERNLRRTSGKYIYSPNPN
jgi:nucleoside-diphosphate-sugar epimerase